MLYRWYALVATAVVSLVAVATRAPTLPQSGPQFHHRQGGEIEGVFFLDATHGYTAEEGARVRYWVDQTQTWEYGETPDNVRVQLRGVYFREVDDDKFGWACGDQGVVLVSDDEGATWTWINETNPIYDNNDPPELATLWAIFMMEDLSTGWAVGTGGTLVKTEDGGATWSYPTGCDIPLALVGTSSHVPYELYDVHFFDDDPDEGIAIADNQTVFVTHDGGCSWDEFTLTGGTPCPEISSGNLERESRALGYQFRGSEQSGHFGFDRGRRWRQ